MNDIKPPPLTFLAFEQNTLVGAMERLWVMTRHQRGLYLKAWPSLFHSEVPTV